MGLFRKKSDDESILVLRTEIGELRQRLEAADAANAALRDRLDRTETELHQQADHNASLLGKVARLDEATTHFDQRIATIGTASEQFASQLATIDRLRAVVAEHQNRLVELPTAPTIDLTDLNNRVEDLSAAIASHRAHLEATDERLATLDEMRVELDDLADSRAHISRLAEQMAALDTRITQVATELAGQIDELGHELDDVTAQTVRPEIPAGLDDDTAETDRPPAALTAAQLEAELEELEELRRAQERLANEQARYQIQFRKDLASLAERLRRP